MKFLKLKFLNSLTNLCSIAGIDKILVIRLEHDWMRFSLLQVKKKKMILPDYASIENFQVLLEQSFPFEPGANATVKTQLETFITVNNLKQVFTLVLTDDFKYHVISLPLETDEGDEVWLTENYAKFLPASLVLDDFIFSFEALQKTETARISELIMIRKNFLEERIAVLEQLDIQLLGVLPTVYFFRSVFESSLEKPLLLIDIQSQFIQYLFKDEARVSRNEFHLNHQLDANNQSSKHRLVEIEGRMNDLKQTLFSANRDYSPSDISLQLICNKSEEPLLTDVIKNTFRENENHRQQFSLSTYTDNQKTLIPVRDFLLQSGLTPDLYKSARASSNREMLEKKYVVNIFLGIGIMFFTMLILLNVLFFTSSHLNEELSEEHTQIMQIARTMELLKKENKFLEIETNSLRNLQYHSHDLAAIFRSVSVCVEKDCALSHLSIKHQKERAYFISLKGDAVSQEAIAGSLQNLEKQMGVSNARLLGTNSIDESAYQKLAEIYAGSAPPDDFFNFSIEFNYVAPNR